MKESNSSKQDQICYACGGTLVKGKTTFTEDFGEGVVVVRNVPATICEKCGMEWIDDEVAAQIEKIVEDAKSKHSIVEVMSLANIDESCNTDH